MDETGWMIAAAAVAIAIVGGIGWSRRGKGDAAKNKAADAGGGGVVHGTDTKPGGVVHGTDTKPGGVVHGTDTKP